MDEIRESNKAFLQDETVTIALENCSQTFVLSKALLCSASSYFSAALNGRFQEATNRTLRLPGCDEEVFQLFVYYITNNKKLALSAVPDGGHVLDPLSDTSQRVMTLIRLWKFADACLMPRLQNVAMRLCCKQLEVTRVDASIAWVAFEGTSVDSPIRSVIIDEAIWDWGLLPEIDAKDLPRLYETLMNEAGAIPGFFFQFYRAVVRNKGPSGRHRASYDENWRWYWINEEST